MATQIDDARRIAADFGVSAQHITQPSHAFLTKVFLIDDAWVLRGRPIVSDTFGRFDRECRLLDKARTLIPYAIPNPIRVPEKEERYVSDGVNLWTMYAMIPGEIHGTWQKVNEIPPEEIQKLLGGLAQLHYATKQMLSERADDWFVRETQKLFQQALDVWSSQEQRILRVCFDRVIAGLRNVSAAELCFVHGDFHHGNVLFDSESGISGLIDCNWSRFSHPFEDVAYTVMTYMRNFNDETFSFDENHFQQLLRWYGFKDVPPFLGDLLVVGALFDFSAWKTMGEEKYAAYQQTLIRDFLPRFI